MRITTETLNILLDCYVSCQRRDTSVPKLKFQRDDLANYTRVAPLAHGCYGDVFIVQSRKNARLYALKRISKAKVLRQPHEALFMAERQCLVDSSDSRFSVGLISAFQDMSFLYLVMPFCSGGDLLSLLSLRDVLAEQEIAFYATEIILALDELHSRGYIHRDIKPENILVGTNGHILLADFGSCVKVEPGKGTRSEHPVGTPDYISPEVLLSANTGMSYSFEVDIWSAGVVLYEMVNGAPPFARKRLQETYRAIQKIEYENEVGSEQMKNLIQKMVCKKDERWDSRKILEYIQTTYNVNHSNLEPPYKPKADWNVNFNDIGFVDEEVPVECGYGGFIGFTYDTKVTLSSEINENTSKSDHIYVIVSENELNTIKNTKTPNKIILSDHSNLKEDKQITSSLQKNEEINNTSHSNEKKTNLARNGGTAQDSVTMTSEPFASSINTKKPILSNNGYFSSDSVSNGTLLSSNLNKVAGLGAIHNENKPGIDETMFRDNSLIQNTKNLPYKDDCAGIEFQVIDSKKNTIMIEENISSKSSQKIESTDLGDNFATNSSPELSEVTNIAVSSNIFREPCCISKNHEHLFTNNENNKSLTQKKSQSDSEDHKNGVSPFSDASLISSCLNPLEESKKVLDVQKNSVSPFSDASLIPPSLNPLEESKKVLDVQKNSVSPFSDTSPISSSLNPLEENKNPVKVQKNREIPFSDVPLPVPCSIEENQNSVKIQKNLEIPFSDVPLAASCSFSLEENIEIVSVDEKILEKKSESHIHLYEAQDYICEEKQTKIAFESLKENDSNMDVVNGILDQIVNLNLSHENKNGYVDPQNSIKIIENLFESKNKKEEGEIKSTEDVIIANQGILQKISPSDVYSIENKNIINRNKVCMLSKKENMQSKMLNNDANIDYKDKSNTEDVFVQKTQLNIREESSKNFEEKNIQTDQIQKNLHTDSDTPNFNKNNLRLYTQEIFSRVQMYLETISNQKDLICSLTDQLYRENKLLKREIRKRESQIDISNLKFMEELKKELKLSRNEVKEVQQRLDSEIFLKEKLQDEIKYLTQKLKHSMKSKKIRQISTIVQIMNFMKDGRKFETKAVLFEITTKFCVIDGQNIPLSNIYMQNLKENELYFVSEKNKRLILKVIILNQTLRKSTNMSSNKSEEELSGEVTKEIKIIEGIDNLLKAVSPDSEIYKKAMLQKEGSLKRIQQLKRDISTKKSILSISTRSNASKINLLSPQKTTILENSDKKASICGGTSAKNILNHPSDSIIQSYQIDGITNSNNLIKNSDENSIFGLSDKKYNVDGIKNDLKTFQDFLKSNENLIDSSEQKPFNLSQEHNSLSNNPFYIPKKSTPNENYDNLHRSVKNHFNISYSTHETPSLAQKSYDFNNHTFYFKTFITEQTCNHCEQILYGSKNQGLMCTECKMIVHKSCYVLIGESCEMYKAAQDGRVFYIILRSIEEKNRILSAFN